MNSKCLKQRAFSAGATSRPSTPCAPRHAPRSGCVQCSAMPKERVAEVTGMAAALSTIAPAAQASELFAAANAVDASSLSFAVTGGVAIAGLGAILVATDPQKR